MPRIKCPKCGHDETVLKSGFIRGVQRYFCKECRYHFTLVRRKHHSGMALQRQRQTTIVDIAKAAGVSVSTVSRALRDHADISPATKSMIRELAAAMDYQPNLVAQSLNSRETHTIGVIVPDIENPFFASVLSGIQHAASAAGYRVMICQSNESHRAEVDNMQIMMNNWVDGLLICHSKETRTFDHVKLQMKKGVPIVHFDRICEEVDTPKVILDNVSGACQIVNHLIDNGCRDIAVVAGPEYLYITRERVEGYRRAMASRGLPVDEELVAYTDFSQRSICHAVDVWMKRERRPDAIFCISDNSAIIVMVYLKRKQVVIPDEVCVAGFGNDYTGVIIDPQLTTFDPYPFRVGEKAVELFFDCLIEGGAVPSKVETIAGRLIVRESSVRREAPSE